jgi:hypothetical protein
VHEKSSGKCEVLFVLAVFARFARQIDSATVADCGVSDFDEITIVVARPRRKERPVAAASRPLLPLHPA